MTDMEMGMAELETDAMQFELDTEEITENATENMYLNFSVGDEVYGIEIRYVIQIIGIQKITEMPDMPPYMKGFINMRGNIIPIYSMRLRFNKFEEEYTDRTCIIVIQDEDRQIGLIVDSIEETRTIEPQKISPPPLANRDSYVMGIARMENDRNAMLIHALKLFD